MRCGGLLVLALVFLAGTARADVFLRLPGSGRWGPLPSGRFAPETVEERRITVNGVGGRLAVFSANCDLRAFWDALAEAQGEEAVFAAGDRFAWGLVRRGGEAIRWMGIADPVEGSVTAFALSYPGEVPRANAGMVPGWLSLPPGARPHLVVDTGDGGSLLVVLRTDGSPDAARASLEAALRDGGWEVPVPSREASHPARLGMYLRDRRWAVVESAGNPGGEPGGVVTLWIAGREP